MKRVYKGPIRAGDTFTWRAALGTHVKFVWARCGNEIELRSYDKDARGSYDAEFVPITQLRTYARRENPAGQILVAAGDWLPGRKGGVSR